MISIGILGAGQLGQMLGQAATSLSTDGTQDIKCIFYDQAKDPCATSVGKVYRDIQEFNQAANIFTYEFENIEQSILQQLASDKKLFPPLEALQIASARYQEKSYFSKLGIDTAKWLPLNNEQDLQDAAGQIGLPFLVKSSRMGYDGKGQIHIKSEDELQQATKDLAKVFSKQQDDKDKHECPYIAEQIINFQREISLLAARDHKGNVVHYPVVENVHRKGILYSSSAPATIDPAHQQLCHEWMENLLVSLSYVGLLTLELFDTGDTLLANEMAPRVHNSGHWTIEGAETSQFANHIRAVAGLLLGSTTACGWSKMYNLVGSTKSIPKQAKTSGHVHIYGKSERLGRKLGHITFRADSKEELDVLCSCMDNHKNFIL